MKASTLGFFSSSIKYSHSWVAGAEDLTLHDAVNDDKSIVNSEEDRIKRKLIRQQSKGESITESDGSYFGSLQKEKVKQDQQKRSKAQRAKDLCETLGRGC